MGVLGHVVFDSFCLLAKVCLVGDAAGRQGVQAARVLCSVAGMWLGACWIWRSAARLLGSSDGSAFRWQCVESKLPYIQVVGNMGCGPAQVSLVGVAAGG